MKKKENCEVVKLGFINRFIFRAKSLSLRENGLYLDDKYVEYPRPLLQSKYMHGIVFDKLLWGEGNYLFIKNNALRILFSDLETKKIQYWSPIYKEYFDQTVDVSKKFENYINTFKRYVRRTHAENWLERLSASKSQLSLRKDYVALGFDVNKIQPALLEFLSDPDGFATKKNAVFTKEQLNSTNHLFDQLEEHPLTERQREACIHDEDNVLVIAGAGTGKTSTMRAKAAYLVQQGYARPEEILMLAYGKDARKELEDRVYELDGLNGVVIRTFHSLGKEIIGHYENRATNVSVLNRPVFAGDSIS